MGEKEKQWSLELLGKLFEPRTVRHATCQVSGLNSLKTSCIPDPYIVYIW